MLDIMPDLVINIDSHLLLVPYNQIIIMEPENLKIITDQNQLNQDKRPHIMELISKNNIQKQWFLKDVILEKPHIIKFVTLQLNVICVPKQLNVDGAKPQEHVYLTVLKENVHILSLLIEKNVLMKNIKLKLDVLFYLILLLKLLILLILNQIMFLNNISNSITWVLKKKKEKILFRITIKELQLLLMMFQITEYLMIQQLFQFHNITEMNIIN